MRGYLGVVLGFHGHAYQWTYAHRALSMEKFTIPLFTPLTCIPALIQPQISGLFCIFNIHFWTWNWPSFPQIPAIHTALFLCFWFLRTTLNNEREACKAIFLVKNLVFLVYLSHWRQAGNKEWAWYFVLISCIVTPSLCSPTSHFKIIQHLQTCSNALSSIVLYKDPHLFFQQKFQNHKRRP